MPPLLYLVRHAHAADAATDEIRPISSRGRGEITQLARFFRANGAFQPAALWHSPLRRAQETAEFLCGDLNLKVPFTEAADLIPEANPDKVAARLHTVSRPLALVGHEPHLSGLASLLVSGDAEPVVFAITKATVLALEPAGSRWCVRWQVSPELLR